MIEEAKVATIAGLLHDIGKFRQRAFWGERRNHQRHGREWVEQTVLLRLGFLTDQQRRQVAEVVEQHHESGVYARDVRVVQLADRLASGERVRRAEEEEIGDPSTELLLPVFARLHVDGRGLDEPDRRRWAYATARLGLGPDFFPRPRDELKADYRELWTSFQRAWDALPDTAPAFEDPDAFVLMWLSLLRVYTWSVPAAAYKDEPDVSLADHLHVTGALSACVWELADPALDCLERDSTAEEPVALLVGGDVSGIQRFLYTVSSAGAAKSFRGRSAYLSLLCEAVAEYVRRSLGLLPCNLLYSGGGHFYLVSPLSSRDRLEELRAQITDLLLDVFGGEVAIVLESVRLLASDLRVAAGDPRSPLGERWKELSERLRQAKNTPLREAALGEPERVFGPFGVGGRETYCVVCHTEPDQPEGLTRRGLTRPVADSPEEQQRKCSLCKSFEDLSQMVKDAEYLVLRQVAPRTGGDLAWHSVLTALGVELWLDSEDELLRHYRPGDWVARLNHPHLRPVQWDGKQLPVIGFRFLPNFTPRDAEGNIREIAEMAAASKGAGYFASLRMDVDNLGRLFSEGFGGRLSMSRVATLSRSLAAFFEGYLNRICNEQDPKKEQVYLLYSGGDDLLAVGSWDTVLALAQEIRSRFHDYVCQNPAVTLCGGTALHHEKFPIYQAAQQAGGLLEAAKAWERGGRTKDAFNLWGQPVEWSDVDWARGWHETICGWLRDEGQVRRAFVFKLARIASLYEERRREFRRRRALSEGEVRRRVRYDRWLWTLVYYLAKEREELRQDLERLREDLVDRNHIEQLALLARWVELSTR